MLVALVATAIVAGFTEADRQVFLWWILGIVLGLDALRYALSEDPR